jgi:hypothetical protein
MTQIEIKLNASLGVSVCLLMVHINWINVFVFCRLYASSLIAQFGWCKSYVPTLLQP